MRNPFAGIRRQVEQYYTAKLHAHGATAPGVDWKSPESQHLRFAQLLKLVEGKGPFSLNDYGCGYGALVDYLTAQGYTFDYRGLDLAPAMIAAARELHAGDARCAWFGDPAQLPPADYTVASGIFNVKQATPEQEWQAYILHTLHHIAACSEKGWAFNILTLYSDPERRRGDLYYADPLFFFDYCKRHFSRFVSLLHDYPLYEFTILVRRVPDVSRTCQVSRAARGAQT